MIEDSRIEFLRSPRVLAIGVFDLFHIGHLRYLEYAKKQGLHLSVAVTPDDVTFDVKGKRPVIVQDQRLEIVRSLQCVDEAQLQPVSTEYAVEAATWIAQWKIDHVVAGGGWCGSERWARLMPELQRRHITVSFAPHTNGISTTEILASIIATRSAAS